MSANEPKGWKAPRGRVILRYSVLEKVVWSGRHDSKGGGKSHGEVGHPVGPRPRTTHVLGHVISTKPSPVSHRSFSLLSHAPTCYILIVALPHPPPSRPLHPPPPSRTPPLSVWHGQLGGTETYYAQGFPVGYEDKTTKKLYVNNHVHMIVDYHPMEVGEVSPFRLSPSVHDIPSHDSLRSERFVQFR